MTINTSSVQRDLGHITFLRSSNITKELIINKVLVCLLYVDALVKKITPGIIFTDVIAFSSGMDSAPNNSIKAELPTAPLSLPKSINNINKYNIIKLKND